MSTVLYTDYYCLNEWGLQLSRPIHTLISDTRSMLEYNSFHILKDFYIESRKQNNIW